MPPLAPVFLNSIYFGLHDTSLKWWLLRGTALRDLLWPSEAKNEINYGVVRVCFVLGRMLVAL